MRIRVELGKARGRKRRDCFDIATALTHLEGRVADLHGDAQAATDASGGLADVELPVGGIAWVDENPQASRSRDHLLD